MRAARGITLLELMITIAIVAVIGSLAAPGLSALRYDAQITTAVNGLLHDLFLARSESLKRGEMISVCKSRDGLNCANTVPDWRVGWMVFVNHDRDEPPQRDNEEPVLVVSQGWPGVTISSNRTAYSFRPSVQGVVNGTLVFCDPRGSSSARAIVISHTGRPRVSRRDSSNKPLQCPAA